MAIGNAFTYLPFNRTKQLVLTIHDGQTAATRTFPVIVLANTGPEVASPIPELTVLPDTTDRPFYANLRQAFTDADEPVENLTFTIFGNTNGAIVTPTIDADGMLHLDLASNQSGTSVITVRAQDSGGLVKDTQFSVFGQSAPDIIAPTSRIAALSAQADDLIIPITVSGTDSGPVGSTISGIAEFRLYVSENGGEFVRFATLLATELSTRFIATSDRNYFFRSIAVDAAGNVESKTVADTQISVGDFDAPETNVVSAVANSLGLFDVTVTGRESGGGRLSFFDVYVSVDDGVAQLIGTAGGGAPDAFGNYQGSVPYQGRTDGLAHTYRFFSIGRDSAGNIEGVPDLAIATSVSRLPLQI